MASLALGIVGGAIGFMVGGPVGAQIGFLAGSLIGSLIDPPKQEGPRLGDLKIQKSTYGAPLPFIWGTGRLAGNMIDQTDLEEHKQKSSGKGGPQITTYTYSASFAIALCASKRFGDPACDGILRIWADARLIWDSATSTDPMPCTFYDGSESQTADPTFEAIHGVGEVPAYRGVAYVVFADYFLTDFGNRIPVFEFEVFTASGAYPWQVSTGTPWQALDYDDGRFEYVDGALIVTNNSGATEGYQAKWEKYDLDLNLLEGPIYTPLDAIVGRAINQNAFVGFDGGSKFWDQFLDVGICVQTTDVTVSYGLNPTNGNYCVVTGPNREFWFYVNNTNSPAFLNKWGNLGNYDTSVSVGAFNGSGCWIGNSDDPDVIYVCYQNPVAFPAGGAELFKYGTDLTLIQHWDAAALSGTRLTHGTLSNFFVYQDQVVFQYKSGPLVNWIALVDIDADTGTASDSTQSLLAQGENPGRLAYLGAGLGANAAYGIFSLVPPAGPVLLSTIVGDLSDMTPVGSYDVSELTDDVRWFVMAQQMTVRNAIQALRQCFFFDAAEIDDQVIFKKRSEASTFSIPDEDLCGRRYGDTSGDPLKTIRKREQELPRTLALTYIDVENDYQTGTQLAQRQTTLSQQDVTLQIPIGLSADEGKQKAETLLTAEWIERESFEFSTTRKWAHLTPCDVGQVHGRVVRIQTKTETPDGVITFGAVLAAPSIYTTAQSSIWYGQSAPGAPADGHITPDPPGPKTATDMILMDMALVSDSAEPNGYPAAVTAHSNAGSWTGCEVFKSADGGTTYNSVGSSLAPDVLGIVAAATGNFAGGNVFDWANKITVVIYSKDGELESATRTSVLNGANLCAIGSTTAGWELIQFMNATLTATNTYELTGLLRGRRGTEWAMSGHGVNETFVLLPTNLDIAGPIGELNASRKFKPVTFGMALADATAQDFTNTGVALKPYAPVHLAGGRNSAGDAVLTWRRRTRLGAGWLNGVDVPLGEAAENYVVTFYTSSTYATALATSGSTSQSLTVSNIALSLTYGSPTPAVGYWGVKQQGTYMAGYESFGTF